MIIIKATPPFLHLHDPSVPQRSKYNAPPGAAFPNQAAIKLKMASSLDAQPALVRHTPPPLQVHVLEGGGTNRVGRYLFFGPCCFHAKPPQIKGFQSSIINSLCSPNNVEFLKGTISR